MNESMSASKFAGIVAQIVANLNGHVVSYTQVEDQPRGPSATITVDGVPFHCGHFYPFTHIKFSVFLERMPQYGGDGFPSFSSGEETNPANMARRILKALPEAQAWVADKLERLAREDKQAADLQALKTDLTANGLEFSKYSGDRGATYVNSWMRVEAQLCVDHVSRFQIDSSLSRAQVVKLMEFLKTL